MALTEQETQIVLYGKESGQSQQAILNALGKYRQQQVSLNLDANGGTRVPVGSETMGDIRQIGTDIKSSYFDRQAKVDAAKDAQSRGSQGGVSTAFQTLGQAAGLVGDTVGAVIKGGAKAVLPENAEEKVKGGIAQVAAPVIQSQPVQTLIQKYEALKTTNPELARNIDASLGLADFASNFVGIGAGAAGAKVVVGGIEQGARAGARLLGETAEQFTRRTGQVADDIASNVGTTVGEIVQKTPDALARFISPDVDPKFATVLKRTTKAEVDEMETIVKNAVDNADNPSAFEIVGNKLADATEQVANQVKSLSQQKKTVISQAKNGLTDFTKETGQTILDISRTVKNSKLAQSFITRLKKVKTKLDADNAIDELQDILYRGNKDMTIPVGSKEDILLKGLLGKYNTTLKNGLPASYRKLNEAISNKLDNLELLNKSLGEVVDGVPIRGASLIKQYFSPSGTKAKELFEFIKKNTGYDVGKDSVLAKYMSEIYGETRAKSLLEGVPTTAQGTLDKLLDFALEKTGVAGKVSDLSRKGKVLKAKSIAK